MEFANRVKTLIPSQTLAITEKAKELKAQGIDVVGLGAGEPDFNTPKHIIEAAYQAMLSGGTKYTATAGLPELKNAIVDKFLNDQNLKYDPSQIIVTNGAKFALYLAFQAILNDGDEVIIPSPYWVSYPEQVKLAGGKPVFISGKEENNFKITPSELEQAVTERTKALVINSPSNPTGVIYSKEELEQLGEVCLKYDILIISDEIYEKLIYGDAKHISIAQISDALKKQTLIVNGLSKSHAMTGWRIGYAAGEANLIKQMTSIASHSTSNPTTHAQYGAVAAYRDNQGVVEEMRKEFAKRLDFFYHEIIKIPGFTCVKPQGAFYLYPNVREAALRCGYEDVTAFVQGLLEEAHVAVVPGVGFGTPDNIRMSYATSMDVLEEAVKRIKTFVENKWQ